MSINDADVEVPGREIRGRCKRHCTEFHAEQKSGGWRYINEEDPYQQWTLLRVRKTQGRIGVGGSSLGFL